MIWSQSINQCKSVPYMYSIWKCWNIVDEIVNFNLLIELPPYKNNEWIHVLYYDLRIWNINKILIVDGNAY